MFEPPHEPDYQGTVGDYSYRAYWTGKPVLQDEFLKAWVLKDGKNVETVTWRDGGLSNTIVHRHPNLASLKRNLHGRMRRDHIPSEDTWDVKQHPRHRHWQKLREEQREAERKAWDVETEHVGDKTLNWIR